MDLESSPLLVNILVNSLQITQQEQNWQYPDLEGLDIKKGPVSLISIYNSNWKQYWPLGSSNSELDYLC